MTLCIIHIIHISSDCSKLVTLTLIDSEGGNML